MNELTAASEAPAEPPVVRVEEIAVDPAYFDWVLDGTATTFKVADNEDNAPLAMVEVADPSELSVRVESPARPADFSVVVYSELDAAGVPLPESGIHVDCLRDQVACSLTTPADEIHAVVTVEEKPRLAVVHLLYANVSPAGAGVQYFSGSWGVKIRGPQ